MTTVGRHPGRAIRFLRWSWLVVGALFIVALLLRTTVIRHRPDLPVIATVPEFRLVDQDGESFGSDDLRGRVWIASFIYTTCPGPCPRIVARTAEVARRMGPREDLLFVSFSVDPQADTPQVLAAYARTRAIDTRRWKFVTGKPEAVFTLVRTGFMLALASADKLDEELLLSEGPIVHSTRLVLVDRELRIRAYYDSTDPQALDRLVEDAEDLLRASSDASA